MNTPTQQPRLPTAATAQNPPAPPTPPPTIHSRPPPTFHLSAKLSPTTIIPPSPITPPQTHRTSPTPPSFNNPPITNVDAVLPRGTLVQIIGNNRTKYELHGLRGYVCSAQTLGGWHEVELVGDGVKKRMVKVQRNALEVLKMGQGGVKVIEGGVVKSSGSTGSERRESGKKRRIRKDGVLRARIEKLDSKSLERYRKVYGLKFGKEPSRDELVWAVKRHFAKQKVDELKVIAGFLKRIYRDMPERTRLQTGA